MSLKKSLYVRSLKRESEEGRRFSDLFLVLRKNLTTSSGNQPYLRLTLGDRSDSIEAFVWDDASEYDRQLAEGEIVSVEGAYKTFRGNPQVVVKSIQTLPEEELDQIDPGEFLPASKRPRQEMWRELLEVLATVQNPALARLFQGFTSDREFREAFQTAPAARGFHHAFIGGLLEHTLGIARLARAVGALYSERLNPEILLAGAFLHDIGKVRELSSRAGFDYTDEGRLSGHIVLGTRLLHAKAAEVGGIPEPLLLHLEHMILSHHGEKEWGSPTEPQTLEAITLHFLDDIDAKVCGAAQWIERESAPGSKWSNYWKGLGKQLYAGSLTGPDFGEGSSDNGPEDVESQLMRLADRSPDAELDSGPRDPFRQRSRGRNPGQGSLF